MGVFSDINEVINSAGGFAQDVGAVTENASGNYLKLKSLFKGDDSQGAPVPPNAAKPNSSADTSKPILGMSPLVLAVVGISVVVLLVVVAKR